MGVGLVYPASLTASSSSGIRPRSAKLSSPEGFPSAVTAAAGFAGVADFPADFLTAFFRGEALLILDRNIAGARASPEERGERVIHCLRRLVEHHVSRSFDNQCSGPCCFIRISGEVGGRRENVLRANDRKPRNPQSRKVRF